MLALQESLDIRRARAAQDSSKSKLWPLANCLNSIGVRLAASGQVSDSIEAYREAVAIYESLLASDPLLVSERLGMAQNNLSGALSDAGLHEEALLWSERSVGLRRVLVDMNPGGHRKGLAIALIGMSHRAFSFGRAREASASITEAIGILRALAREHSFAFIATLAEALNAAAIQTAQTGRPNEALNLHRESVDIYRRAAEESGMELRGLSIALNNFSITLRNSGRLSDSEEAAAEALKIVRDLVIEHRDENLPRLRLVLKNVAALRHGQGMHEAELADVKEELRVVAELAELDPSVWGSALNSDRSGWLQQLQSWGHESEAIGLDL
jgi:tetratricopeptide (TPR) repeat protein